MKRCCSLFDKKAKEDKKWELFRPILNIITNSMYGIKFDNVSIDICNVGLSKKGSLIIRFFLSNDMILSIQKTLEESYNSARFCLSYCRGNTIWSSVDYLYNIRNYVLKKQEC